MAEINVENIRSTLTQKSVQKKISKGQIEYSIRGDGPIILCIHGGPGGYDQGLLLGEVFRVEGFQILSISRAGYLGSDLDTGRTFEDQADSLAELLEVLDVDKVFLLHASAGGPTGYTFAKKYSNKIEAHVAVDSVCLHYAVNVSKAQEMLFMNKYGLWLANFFADHFPKSVFEQLLKAESTLTNPEIHKRVNEILKDPIKVEFIKCLMKTMSTKYKERKIGLDNDLMLFAKIDKLPMGGISCPTLIFHGDSDKDVAIDHAIYANKSIPNSEIVWIEKASHLGFWASDRSYETQKRTVEFFRDHHS